MSWISIIFSILLAWLTWTAVTLYINFHAARHTGLPTVISPVHSLNPLWILSCRFLPVITLLKSLPWIFGKFPRCNYIGWAFDDKDALHEELGDAFVLVNPGINEIHLANPEAVTAVLGRRKDFIKPALLYEQMNVFGTNVNTAEGETWQRHRKITAPSFNERVSGSVWDEAVRQTQEMLQAWISSNSLGTTETVQDTAIVALHVLTGAGFGLKFSFSHGLQSPRLGFVMSYRDALLVALKLLPKRLGDVWRATVEFEKYMNNMLAEERSLISEGKAGSGNLMSALVRASEEANDTRNASAQGLTDKEILGNIFMYNLAGYETTANTMAYAIVLLAAYPDWQDWLAEEIQSIKGHQSWEYETAFPKLKRCLATMFEVLRLYGSIVFIPKSTGHHGQTLRIKGHDHYIPPNTFVTTNVQALHASRRIWGPDASTWRPSRWLSSSHGPTPDLESETMIEPPKGTFVAWADGPRTCPGRKFAQVEFVAVMAMLFREHRVRPALQEGESVESGKQRLLEMVHNSAISAITLQTQNSSSVPLIWSRKE